MKPFHFYLFLLFACWLQPQVLPAQDNRLAEHPFSQDSWYRADSMQYFYLHAHKLRPIHRGAGGIYGNFEERMPFKLIYSLKFGEWQDSIYCRKCDIEIADVDSSFVQMELRNLVLKETPSAAVLVEEFGKKSDGTARMLHPRRDSWQTRHARQHRPRRQALRLPPLLQATSQ